MNEFIGFAVLAGKQLLGWTVHPDPEQSKKAYVDFRRADNKSIKTFEDCGDSKLVHVRVTTFDPARPLDDPALEVWLAGYRRGIKDSNADLGKL